MKLAAEAYCVIRRWLFLSAAESSDRARNFAIVAPGGSIRPALNNREILANNRRPAEVVR